MSKKVRAYINWSANPKPHHVDLINYEVLNPGFEKAILGEKDKETGSECPLAGVPRDLAEEVLRLVKDAHHKGFRLGLLEAQLRLTRAVREVMER